MTPAGPVAEAPGTAPGRLFAEVALDAAEPGTPRLAGRPEATFHYSLPAQVADEIAVGQLVWVPFGRRELQGLVVGLTPTSPVERHRDVLAIVAPTPWVTARDVAVARWMSRHYLAGLFDCLRPFLPPGTPGAIVTTYERGPLPVRADAVTAEQLVVLGLFADRGRLTPAQVARRIGRDATQRLGQLVADGLLRAQRRPAPPDLAPKRVTMLRLVELDPGETEARLAAAFERAAVARRGGVALLAELEARGGSAAQAEALAASGAGPAALRRLAAAGLVVVGSDPVWRDPLAADHAAPAGAPILSADQARAWHAIEGWLAAAPRPGRAHAGLVYGVTGSGKTELYLRAIERVLAAGRQAIVLVPEIALTPQAVARYTARLGPRVGLLHSGLPPGQRVDTWRRAHGGDLDVVIGSRSAVFAPLPRPGLIVIDEEHADSYKQETTPRYHARAVAMRRAMEHGAVVLLGSATPAVETWHAAATGRLRRVDLPRRVAPPARPGAPPGWASLPPVHVVDMRSELRAGHTDIFSRPMLTALTETLAAGEQAILFLNRRGSATFVLCRDCGHVRRCPRCDIPLTFHAAGPDLVCHHCRYREPPPAMCPVCASGRIRYFGAGTQRVEMAVREHFPAARVLRWDADTTARRGAHAELLARFAAGRADVLVGTQMVAKGLDLPGVTLVGVVLADTALALPDFRAAERTFHILAQVAGRAGRAGRPGRVVFQTYRPDDPTILAAARHDAAAFYAAELAFRAAHRYPPFARLVRLEHRAATDNAAERSAAKVATTLRGQIDRLGLPDTDVIGPAPAFFHHLRGQVRWQIVVRGPDPAAALADVRLGRGWWVDVDPVALL